MASAACLNMGLPSFTVLTKCDLVPDKKKLKSFLKLKCVYDENDTMN